MPQNPFYVHPGGDYGQGLTGLAGSMMDAYNVRQEQETQQKAAEKFAAVKTAFTNAAREKDTDKLLELSIEYPEMGQAVSKAYQMQSGLEEKEAAKQEEEYKSALFSWHQNPTEENAQAILEERADLNLPGSDQFIDRFRANPDIRKKIIEMELAVHAPKRLKAYREAMAGPEGDKPTGDIQNFNHYQTLLRENPEEAAKFATQVGITPKPVDDRTQSIKEFEYGEKNPKFKLAQKAKEDAKKTKETEKSTFEDSSKLRKEYLAQSKEYQKVRDAYTRVVNSTKEPSPAGDLSLIFNYMKMLDPGSVVRESEFATAAAAGSYGERIKAATQKVLSGERLSPTMRADFLKKSGELMGGMEKQHSKRVANYTGIAKKNNFPVDEVVVDITAPVEESEPEKIKDQEKQDTGKIKFLGFE